MNQISLQAVQFVPHFAGVLVLLALTWLISKFAKYIFGRTGNDRQNRFSKLLGNLAAWVVFILMAPFIFSAAGIDASWLNSVQKFVTQVFVNWPLWMILSLVFAGILFLVRETPKFFLQLKGSFGTSQSEVQS